MTSMTASGSIEEATSVSGRMLQESSKFTPIIIRTITINFARSIRLPVWKCKVNVRPGSVVIEMEACVDEQEQAEIVKDAETATAFLSGKKEGLEVVPALEEVEVAEVTVVEIVSAPPSLPPSPPSPPPPAVDERCPFRSMTSMTASGSIEEATSVSGRMLQESGKFTPIIIR